MELRQRYKQARATVLPYGRLADRSARAPVIRVELMAKTPLSLPFLTNFDTTSYPLQDVLPRLLASDGTRRGDAEAVIGSKIIGKVPGAVDNYVTSLGAIGLCWQARP